MILAGQVIVHGVPPVTLTVKLQEAGLPDVSALVQLTVVVPIGKLDPEGGLQETGSAEQDPFFVGAE